MSAWHDAQRLYEGTPFDNKAGLSSQAASYFDQMPAQPQARQPGQVGTSGDLDPNEVQYLGSLLTDPVQTVKKFGPSDQKTLQSIKTKLTRLIPTAQSKGKVALEPKQLDPSAEQMKKAQQIAGQNKPTELDGEESAAFGQAFGESMGWSGASGADDEEYIMGVQNGTLGAAEMAEGNWSRAAALAAGLAFAQPAGDPNARVPSNTEMAISHRPMRELDAHIDQLAAEHGVPAVLIRAMISVESSGNPAAKSGAGARGMMQLMPDTAKSLGVKDVHDPFQNIEGGVKYMKKLLGHTNGNIDRALAYYNFGPNAASKTPPQKWPAETKKYIRSVREKMKQLKAAKRAHN
jgi:hypothetical protein